LQINLPSSSRRTSLITAAVHLTRTSVHIDQATRRRIGMICTGGVTIFVQVKVCGEEIAVAAECASSQ
jgi:hypothetical protein